MAKFSSLLMYRQHGVALARRLFQKGDCDDLTPLASMPSETAIKSFIASTFRSVWAMDLIRVLLVRPDRALTRPGLIEALRASESVIQQSVESLSAAGMVVADGDVVRLREFDRETSALLEEAIDLYRVSPDKVRRLIVAQSLPGATAFSDAFRLWKD